MTSSTLVGGSIRILWDEADSADVTITGSNASFTVGGVPVSFPYTLTSSTTFTTTQSGTYTVSVQHYGYEIAGTPDGTRQVSLRFGEEEIFAPTPDSRGGGDGFASMVRDIVATDVPDDSTDIGAALSATFVGAVVLRGTGIDPTGTTDSSAAIRTKLAGAAAFGADTYAPEGDYLVSEDGTTYGCLNLPSGTRLRGPGRFILASGQRAAVRPIQVGTGVTDVAIKNISVDMNGNGGTAAHCIFLDSCSDVTIEDVDLATGTRGGIGLYGTASHVRINRAHIDSPVFNGITFLGDGTTACAVDDVFITGCHIEAGVQPIDSEPSVGHASNVRIIGNYLKATGNNYAITMSGIPGDPNQGWIVSGNTLIGAVWAVDVENSEICNNHIDATGTTLNAVHGYYHSDQMTVTGNTIVSATDKAGVSMAMVGSAKPSGWKVNSNDITTTGTSASGIDVLDAGPTTVIGNSVRGANGLYGIRARAAGADMKSVTIVGNDVDGFARGVYALTSSTYQIKRLIITANSIDNTQGTPTVTAGIALGGTASQILQTVLSGNIVESVYTTPYSLGSFLVRDGMGDTPNFSGNGTPEGVVTAKIGSLYKRRDGAANTSLYVKESGTGNTGWAAYGPPAASSDTDSRLTADTTPVNNSTTAVDTGLSFSAAANSVYEITSYIEYSADAAADINLSWSVPSGTTLGWTVDASAATASTANNSIHRSRLGQASNGPCGGIGVGTKMVARPAGTLVTGGTAGTVSLKFAQAAASATDAVIHAGSWLHARKIA